MLKGGTKLLKGGTKLLKGGTKSWGWATGGGGGRPTPRPLATGLHIQDGGKLLSKNVPFWSVLAHNFETSGWNNNPIWVLR